MPFPANTFEWIWHWRDAGGNDFYNVWHFRDDSGSAMTVARSDVISAILRTELASTTGRTAAWRSYINQFSGLNDQIIRDVSGATSFEDTDAIAVLGTAVTDTLPPQVSLLVQKKTASAGRRARGRAFLAPFAEGTSDVNGDPTLALRTDVATSLAYIRDAMATNSTPLVVASQEGTPTDRNITNFSAGPKWRTQRRRALRSS